MLKSILKNGEKATGVGEVKKKIQKRTRKSKVKKRVRYNRSEKRKNKSKKGKKDTR